jgi:predicted RNase H-like nuclease (RuvC/YqgF family)
MIYVRSWDSHCPPLFTAQTIEEARSIVSRLGYTDVWYDTHGEPSEALLLKAEINDLKEELEEAIEQRDEAREANNDCDHDDRLQELEQTVDEHRSDLIQAKAAIRQLDSHLDLMKAIVANAT